MKAVLEDYLNATPYNMMELLDKIRDRIIITLEEALDVQFSESESVIIAHTVMGILSARNKGTQMSHYKKNHPPESASFVERIESVSDEDEKDTAPIGDYMDCHRRHEIIVASQDFPLMNLDHHSLLSNILTYLPYEDLNSLAVCSRRLHELRSDPGLNQTRSITLNFRNNRTGNGLTRLVQAISNFHLWGVLCDNRTTLRLRGFVEALDDDTLSETDLDDDIVLPNVTCLDLSYEQRPDNPYISFSRVFYNGALERLLPNVQELDIQHSDDFTMLCNLKSSFPNLRSIWANDSELDLFYEGDILRRWEGLREMKVQGHKLYKHTRMRYGLPPHIERLDMRFFRVASSDYVPTSEILDLLRYTPTLQWLRCDASPDDLLMLKKERPDVTIINF